ncbi:unnamed protein product [Schistosoma margrebowiei]|uniref:Uncharacterized protein n=1 Tax=Schistosoma margrebowiei TaxID=48269 RepID=A0A183MQJ0_9TREM|nr:unnamed protein product [Schistosoma margrebowiei]
MSSAISELAKTINNMSSTIIDLNVNVNQLLSKFHEREKPHQFDCGLSSQQFPLSSEEELQMLDTAALTHRFLSSSVNEKDLAALTHRFLSSSVNEKDLGKLYDIATQGYFHDIRDKMIKRYGRKDNQVCTDLK